MSYRLNQVANYSETEMQILVPVDSKISDISQLKEVLTASPIDEENTKKFLEHLEGDQKVIVEDNPVSSYQESYDRLLDKKEPAMVFNRAYLELLEMIYPDYASKTKVIYHI